MVQRSHWADFRMKNLEERMSVFIAFSSLGDIPFGTGHVYAWGQALTLEASFMLSFSIGKEEAL